MAEAVGPISRAAGASPPHRAGMRTSLALVCIVGCLAAGCTATGETGRASDRTATAAGQVPSSAAASPPTHTAPAASPIAAPKSPAAAWLSDQLTDLNDNLYVYRDFGDGANTYTQKAWMGSSDVATPMAEDADGIDGTTGIEAGLDLSRNSWGGYQFLSGALAAGSNEPQADFGASAPGPDLRGASRLTFWAKGAAGGERVRFFLGGLGTREKAAHPDSVAERSIGPVRLTTQWRQYTIGLGRADLSSVTLGFGWVANADTNPAADSIRFWLDEIRYEFDSPRDTPQLIASYAPAPPGTDQAIINGFAYTYDNAIAALALLRQGDIAAARRLGDAFVYALGHDRSFSDGRLRNAYANGDPRSAPGWLAASGETFARMPGFWDTAQQRWNEDYYADSTATGTLAWAILALVALHDAGTDSQDATYLQAATRIGQAVLALQRPGSGFAGGYEGFDDEQTKASYLSTEHNLDLIPAFAQLARRTSGTTAERFEQASADARAFVLTMRNPDGGFWTGTASDGVTPSQDVLPLDTNTWAVLALGDTLPDAARTMAFVERHMALPGGYDFNSDKDGIWNEGTAQAVLAYRALGQDAKANEVLSSLQSRALPDGSITAADRDGVTTGFTVSGTDQPWRYDRRVHLGATAWLAFAQQDYNPLKAG